MDVALDQRVKLCTRCGIPKEVAEFGKNRAKASGLALYCKACMRILSSANYVE